MNWTDRSEVYPAFIQAHLPSWLHGTGDRCKNDCPANGLAIKVLNLQQCGARRRQICIGANGEKKREGEGFEIL